jgi:hypothetical protein
MKRTTNASPWGAYDADGSPALSPWGPLSSPGAEPSELLTLVRLALANRVPNPRAVKEWALANEDWIMSLTARRPAARVALRTAFALWKKASLGQGSTPVGNGPDGLAPRAHAAHPSASAAASQPSRRVMAQGPLQLCPTCGGAGLQHMSFPGNIPESGFNTVVPCATCGGTGYKRQPKHKNNQDSAAS